MNLEGLEALKLCRDEVMHEYNVLTGRLTTYITSQAFLVNAYAVAMNNANPRWGETYQRAFPGLICLAGFLLTLQAYPGIDAVCRILDRWHVHQDKLFALHPNLSEFSILGDAGVRQRNGKSLLFARWSSWIFGAAWIALAGIALWLTAPPRT